MITIKKLKADEPTPFVTVDRMLLLTADKTRIVEEGDPAGAFVYASPGTRCAREELLRLGVRVTRAGKEKKQSAKHPEKVETAIPKSRKKATKKN